MGHLNRKMINNVGSSGFKQANVFIGVVLFKSEKDILQRKRQVITSYNLLKVRR